MTDSALVPIVTLILSTLVGLAIGVSIGRRGSKRPTSAPDDARRQLSAATSAVRDALRGQALDVTAEAILVVGADGRVRDCNAAALLLFDRHRSAVEQVDAAALRLLLAPTGAQLEWDEVLATCAPWSGDAHVRLPDGSRLVCLTRLVPLFDADGAVTAMVEVYRGQADRDSRSENSFVRALDTMYARNAADEASVGDDPVARAQRELGHIVLAFADLERVVLQYERLLPALRAEDPLAEAIAGIAAETRDLAAATDIPRLLDELPRALERLRAQVARLSRQASHRLPPE